MRSWKVSIVLTVAFTSMMVIGTSAHAKVRLKVGDRALFSQGDTIATIGVVSDIASDGMVTIGVPNRNSRTHITADGRSFSKEITRLGNLHPGIEVVSKKDATDLCKVARIFQNGKVNIVSSSGYDFIEDANNLSVPARTARR